MLMLLIHAGLLLWASLMVVGVRHKVDVTGGYISVNEALQVFGPEMQASGTTLPTARARQAHVRIASHAPPEQSGSVEEVSRLRASRSSPPSPPTPWPHALRFSHTPPAAVRPPSPPPFRGCRLSE